MNCIFEWKFMKPQAVWDTHTFSPGAAAVSRTSLYALCKSWTKREIEGRWTEANFTQTPAQHYSLFGKVTKLRISCRKKRKKSVTSAHAWPTRWKRVPLKTKLLLLANFNISRKEIAPLRICQPAITFTYLRTCIHAAQVHIEHVASKWSQTGFGLPPSPISYVQNVFPYLLRKAPKRMWNYSRTMFECSMNNILFISARW